MTPEEKAILKKNFNVRIGQRIAELRKEAGMSQAQLAERAGIQRTHLTRIEQGQYEVTGWVLQTIAEALGLTMDIIKVRK